MPNPLRLLDAFAGIGGFSLAAHTLGTFTTTQFIEQNPYCQSILAKHWPDVPIHDDIRTFTASPGTFDVITAGFPCQDLSTAGKQLGFAGNRSVLFYEVIRLLRDIRPKFLVLENVANLVTHADGQTFQEVLYSLAKAGYDAEWAVIPASDVGACHLRKRWWCVAYAANACSLHTERRRDTPYVAGTPRASQADRQERQRHGDAPVNSSAAATNANNTRLEGRQPVQLPEHPIQCAPWPRNPPSHQLSPDWRSFVSEPVLRRGDARLSGRVDRLKALGNAVVPQVAMIPLRRLSLLHALSRDTP
jgi:DNA (cytosine-5)-methyltransferase 1